MVRCRRIRAMRSPFSSTGKMGHLAALMLVLWLGGLSCVLGCTIRKAGATVEERVSSTQSGTTVIEAGSSCPSGKAAQGCCKKGATSAKEPKPLTHEALTTSLPSPSGGRGCCPLLGNTADVARRSRVGETPLAASLETAGPRVVNDQRQLATPAHPPRLADRGHTYLRHCVFLI